MDVTIKNFSVVSQQYCYFILYSSIQINIRKIHKKMNFRLFFFIRDKFKKAMDVTMKKLSEVSQRY